MMLADDADTKSSDAGVKGEPLKEAKVGVRVRRGPDWKWHDQDKHGGVEQVGITEHDTSDGWIKVAWDHGVTHSYRCRPGAFDLVYAESTSDVEDDDEDGDDEGGDGDSDHAQASLESLPDEVPEVCTQESIRKVLTQVHPDMRPAKDTLQAIQTSLGLLFVLLVRGVAFEGLGEDEQVGLVTEAINAHLPGELGRHAVSEGGKATKTLHSGCDDAGLQFNIDIVAHASNAPMTKKAACWLAAVLEYMSAEMLELAGDTTRDDRIETFYYVSWPL